MNWLNHWLTFPKRHRRLSYLYPSRLSTQLQARCPRSWSLGWAFWKWGSWKFPAPPSSTLFTDSWKQSQSLKCKCRPDPHIYMFWIQVGSRINTVKLRADITRSRGSKETDKISTSIEKSTLLDLGLSQRKTIIYVNPWFPTIWDWYAIQRWFGTNPSWDSSL